MSPFPYRVFLKYLSKMQKISTFILLTSVVAISVGLDCSHLIFKKTEGAASYLAWINWTVPIMIGPRGWNLTLTFDEIFTGVGVWQGFVTYNGTEKWAEIRNRNSSDAQLEAGEKRAMRFSVNYVPYEQEPNVISLKFQEIQLCN